MSRVGKFLQEHGVAVMLIAAIATMAASSQAATPTAPAAAPKKHVVSPYARAAAQREGLGLLFCCAMSSVSLGQAPTHAPTPTLAAAPPATHPGRSSPYRRMKLSERARECYPAVW